MKLSIVAAVATLAASAMAKNYIVSFDSETPQSTVDSAMKQVIAAGGHITHVYDLIKGFAVEAPEEAVAFMGTLSTEFKAEVEEDKEVHIMKRNFEVEEQ